MIVRPAEVGELSFLQAKLAQREQDGFEQLDLRKSVVLVAEDDELRAGLVSARLMWQVEPLILFPEFERTSLPIARKKATYLLARHIEDYIADRARNRTGLHSFFAFIEDRNPRMQGLARHIGWMPVYRKGKFFGKDT